MILKDKQCEQTERSPWLTPRKTDIVGNLMHGVMHGGFSGNCKYGGTKQFRRAAHTAVRHRIRRKHRPHRDKGDSGDWTFSGAWEWGNRHAHVFIHDRVRTAFHATRTQNHQHEVRWSRREAWSKARSFATTWSLLKTLPSRPPEEGSPLEPTRHAGFASPNTCSTSGRLSRQKLTNVAVPLGDASRRLQERCSTQER